ncbi:MULTISPECIES: hypothetical protein [Vibrio]|jgi:hypothetical protein|uniref:hypothetical protein n=1 Tax=Vibrio TaxID=662 RepID=UPI000681E9D0|nr:MULTISPECIES: hypothetical protein [Vibrio]MPS41583.1 hypothetical protein [Vibrio sp. VGrn 2]HDM8062593.1 hypothetical protein [Vibrio harveyi]
MKQLILIFGVLLSSGCVHSSLGYADKKENGESVESYETCMANCLERSENGQKCVKFSEGMAKVCKDFKS